MTRRITKDSFASLAIVLFALAPALLFAYLGQFMRMMRDDYYRIAVALESGPINIVLNRRNSWGGSFGNVFFQGVLGPLDGTITQLMPALIIAIWLPGLIWLLAIASKRLHLAAGSLMISTVMASLLLAATINGLYSLETLYWYTASTAYALPLALAVLGIALTLALAQRCRSQWHKIGTAIIAGLAAFATASFSEMYLVFQLAALPFLAVVAVLLVDRSHRRLALFLILVGWVATIANALVQVTAPGISDRVEWYVSGGVTTPIRSLSRLIPMTINLTLQYVADQRTFAGFTLLFAAGLVASPGLDPAKWRSSAPRSLSLPALPLWLGLLVQVCFVTILWTHSSDSPSVLGRFSYGYMVVICLNAAVIVAFIALIRIRARMSAKLRESPRFTTALTVALWISALAFFALTQYRSIHYKAAGYLFVSAISVLAVLSCVIASATSARDTWRGAVLIAICFVATVLSAFVLLGLANYSIGYVRDRVMAPVSLLLAMTGLVWGACMGSWLKSILNANGPASVWLARYQLAGALVAVTIVLGIFFGRLQWLPELELYAREWDARHQYLLAKRAEGASQVVVAPLAYDMSQYFWEADISMAPENISAEKYYGIENIDQTRHQ